MVLQFIAKARARFRRNPRVGLRSPKRTKAALRWAISRRVAAIYVLAVVWPVVVIAILATGAIVWSSIPPKVTPWLYYAKVSLAAVLAWMYAVDAAIAPVRSWFFRYARKDSNAA